MKSEGLQFYRCMLCHRIVSEWDIKKHLGCQHCGGNKIQPSNLTIREKIIQIWKHPAVWRWKNAGK